MGLASSLPVDFNEFAKYLEKERKRNWKQILCYAQNYAHVLTTGSAKDLLTLSSSRRKHAMEALAALSKFTGRYQVWRQIRESHQLKWSDSEEDNLRFFERFTSGEEDYPAMVAWLKEAIAKLPSPVGNVLVFNTMTGLRPTEACQSISIIKQGGQGYVNHVKQVIEHFRRPETFFRKTKKAYVSIITPEIINLAERSEVTSWKAIRSNLIRRNLPCHSKYCRSIFATHLRTAGIEPETIDVLQGRIPKTVFARHYFKPNFKEGCMKISKLLNMLYDEIIAESRVE
jgi:Archaeal phage integrase